MIIPAFTSPYHAPLRALESLLEVLTNYPQPAFLENVKLIYSVVPEGSFIFKSRLWTALLRA